MRAVVCPMPAACRQEGASSLRDRRAGLLVTGGSLSNLPQSLLERGWCLCDVDVGSVDRLRKQLATSRTPLWTV